MSIEAIQKNLANIFNLAAYQFKIPTYQRPYAWKEEQASDLINDIISVFPYGDENPQEYFLGSIVLIKPEAHEPHSEVVDGQQRLTSLTLLFSVLRYLLPSEMTAQKSQMTTLLATQDIINDQDLIGLKLREQDEKFFSEYVRNLDGIEVLLSKDTDFKTNSQKLFQKNAKLFIHEIQKQCPQNVQLKDWVIHIYKNILKYCYLVVVSTQDFDTAYRIKKIGGSTATKNYLLSRRRLIPNLTVNSYNPYSNLYSIASSPSLVRSIAVGWVKA